MTNVSPLPITFYRFRKDGTPNPDIKRAFLQTLTLGVEDAIRGKLWLEDKSEWILVLEPAVHAALRLSSSVSCIVSFQLRIQGAYAIARLNTKEHTEASETSEEQNS